MSAVLGAPRRRERLRLPVMRGPARWPALLLGCVAAAAGITALLAAGLGVGPYDVLITGVATRQGVTFGTASVLVSVLATALGWRLGGQVGRGTVATAVLVGPLVDAWSWLLPLEASALPTRVVLLGGAIVLIAFGLSLVVAASLGPGPLEVVTLGLTHRGVPLRWARTVLEGSVLAVGWALGGAVGVGTIVVALTIGHGLALFVPSAVATRG